MIMHQDYVLKTRLQSNTYILSRKREVILIYWNYVFKIWFTQVVRFLWNLYDTKCWNFVIGFGTITFNNFFLIYYKVIKKIFVITKVGSCLDCFYFYFQIKQKSIIWYFQKTNKVKMLFKKLKILKILTHTI